MCDETKNGNECEYISERVINMAECEDLIRAANFTIGVLRKEFEKDEPYLPFIDEHTKSLHKLLLELSYFEFRVERRKTVGVYQ